MERFNQKGIGLLRIGLLTLLLGFCCLGRLTAQTGTFIDRDQATDLRVVSYNVLWNTIFPQENPTQAAKFERVVQAIDADIWNLQEIGPDNNPSNPSVDDVVDLMNTIMPLPGGATWYGHQSWDSVIVSKYPLTDIHHINKNSRARRRRTKVLPRSDSTAPIRRKPFHCLTLNFIACTALLGEDT